ncbi:MAG: hypothetical protein IH840_01280 [Candidatus Heimdallarchaeota archaeon]|nr:hypothetical protein [Candidatus Heimdallarchaeota archaeon]
MTLHQKNQLYRTSSVLDLIGFTWLATIFFFSSQANNRLLSIVLNTIQIFMSFFMISISKTLHFIADFTEEEREMIAK